MSEAFLAATTGEGDFFAYSAAAFASVSAFYKAFFNS